ncbi:hypothetical protein [Sediminicola luteus]|uniref:Uncharacterized protein n=1 Tax=Sediminicola luteus TaxID=319238 RepID=A0ABV2TZE1_9FLAO
MNHASLILLVFLLNMSYGFSQQIKIELHKFIGNEFVNGKYSFRLMKNKLVPIKTKTKVLTDENGNMQIIELEQEHIVPEFKFVKSGSIVFSISYNDSILSLRPIQDSFAPIIRVDLSSTSAYLNDQHLSIIKEIKVSDKENAFNSAWEGFQWRTFLPDSSSPLDPKLTLGKLNENGNLYIEIIWMEKGIPIHYRLLY